MKLCCPVCSSKFSFEQIAHEALMMEMVELAAFFGPLWSLAVEYSDCFRLERWGSVTLKKRLRILNELRKLVNDNEFDFGGRRYRTERGKIVEAIRVVVNREKFGFDNHNYLKKVLIGEKAERVSAEGLTAQNENRIEQDRRDGATKDRRTLREFQEAHPEVAGLAWGVGKEF